MSPRERRAYLLGLRRGRQQARKQLRTLAEEYDAELVSFGDEFGELIRDRYSSPCGEEGKWLDD